MTKQGRHSPYKLREWKERRSHRYVRQDRRAAVEVPPDQAPLLFNEVAELCPAGIVVIAGDGRIRYTNPRAQSMLGLSREEYESRDYDAPQWNVTDFEGRAIASEDLCFSRVMRDKVPVLDAEHAVARADGARLYLRISGQPLLDRSGNVDQVVFTMTDMTGVVLAARAQRDSDRLFESALENAPIGMAIVGLDGRWIKVNQAVCEITGYASEELAKMTFQDITYFEDLDTDLAYVNQLLSGVIRSYRMVKRYVRKDRSLVWINLSGSLIRNDAGEPIHFVAQIVDLTEQRMRERKLRESEEHFRMMVDSVLDYEILMLDTEGTILSWNAGAERIKGYKADEIVGKKFHQFYTPEDIAAGKPEHELIVAAREGRYEEEGWRLRKNGSKFWANVVITAVRNEDGSLRGYSKLTRDQTERRRTDNQLQESRQKLEQSVLQMQQQHREMTLFSEFSGVLQSCMDFNEISASVRRYGRMLMPQCSGALFLLQASRNHLEPAGGWGDEVHAQKLFAPHSCWALRRGQAHLHVAVDDLCCSHVTPDEQQLNLCIPIIAQNHTLGLLYVEASKDAVSDLARVQALAAMVAERVGTSIANLRLRESLRQQSIRDTLTQLYNRRYLDETAQRELAAARRGGNEVTVMMIDVDHFKRFNDSHGHEAGDSVLRMLAQQLERSCRQSDIACRYGGEEFVLVLSNTNEQQGLMRARALCEGVHNQELFLHGHSLGYITISIGVAVYPHNSAELQGLIEVADRALYQAKRDGRNCVRLASQS